MLQGPEAPPLDALRDHLRDPSRDPHGSPKGSPQDHLRDHLARNWMPLDAAREALSSPARSASRAERRARACCARGAQHPPAVGASSCVLRNLASRGPWRRLVPLASWVTAISSDCSCRSSNQILPRSWKVAHRAARARRVRPPDRITESDS